MRKFACIVEISTKVMVSYFFNVHPVVWLFTRQRNVTDSLLRLLFTAAVMAKIHHLSMIIIFVIARSVEVLIIIYLCKCKTCSR